MGFLDGLSAVVSGATDVASGYEGGVAKSKELDRRDAIEAIKNKRQAENDEITNALKKAQTQRALQNPTHLIWKINAQTGEYEGLPTTDEGNSGPGTPVAPGPTKSSDAGPSTADSASAPQPAQPGPLAPTVKSGVKAPPIKPGPYSQEAITADSTKAANRRHIAVANPLPPRTAAGSQEEKANRAFVLKRIGAYMNPQYDSASQGILKAPPLSREQAAQKAVQDARESGQFPNIYPAQTPKAKTPTQKAPQGHSRDIGKQPITTAEAQALKAMGHSDQDIAAHYIVSG